MFWARVARRGPDECWEWRGSRNAKGYGQVTNQGADRIAHRVAYEIAKGAIPSGMMVCHTCDNPPCCNPAHLFVGSNADNIRDKVAKGRSKRRYPVVCPNGHEFTASNCLCCHQRGHEEVA